MPNQPVIPGLREAIKTKVIRREQFLADMDAVEPWTRRSTFISPHYSKVGKKGGLPPMPVETVLRGLCCTNPVRDSSRDSSMVADLHEQTDTANLQDQKLAGLQ